jgi:hypothetical protein
MRSLLAISLLISLTVNGQSLTKDSAISINKLQDTVRIQAQDTIKLASDKTNLILINNKESKHWLDYLSAILVPLTIGFLAFWVGRKQNEILKSQNKIQEYEIRFALLERRMKIYEDVRKTLNEIDKHFSVLKVDTKSFFESKRHSKFLFNTEVQEYIEDIDFRIIRLQQIEPKIEGTDELSPGETLDDLKSKKTEMINWLKNQQPTFENKFLEFMKLNKI